MASIEKLSIRGIRAFSPDQECVMEFYSPLTMIHGHNGCGKTTIIECLKYMLTGSLPPGTRSGQYFINDPKVSGAQEVKAGIKLRFKNRAGNSMTSVRLFQLTQGARNRLTFKALDGTIRYLRPDGETVSASNKCLEMDSQMPELFGVSKAILENVVFCHQEDSNWPLMEGKFLKEKFDDIFEATRYSKALDAIRKNKKFYSDKVKDLKADLMQFAERLNTAQTIQRDVEDAEKAVNRNRDAIEVIDKRIDEMQLRLEEVAEKARRMREKERGVNARRQEVDNKQREVDVQRQGIRNPLDGTEAQLERHLDTFEEDVSAQQDKLERREREVARKREGIQELTAQREKLVRKLGSLSANLESLKRTLDQRDDLARSLARKHNVALREATRASQADDAGVSCIDAEVLADFLGKLRERLREKQGELEETRTKCRAIEDAKKEALAALRGERDGLRRQQEALEVQIVETQRQREEAIQRDNELRSQGVGMGFSATDGMNMVSQPPTASSVEDAKARVEREKDALERQKKDPRWQSIPHELKGDREKLEKLQREGKELLSRRTTLESSLEESKEIEDLHRQLKRDRAEFESAFHIAAVQMDVEKYTGEELKKDANGDATAAISSAVEKLDAARLDAGAEEMEARKKHDKARDNITKVDGLLLRDRGTVERLDALMAPLASQFAGALRNMQHFKDKMERNEETAALVAGKDIMDVGEEILDFARTFVETKEEKVEQYKFIKKHTQMLKQTAMNERKCACCERSYDTDAELDNFFKILQARMEKFEKKEAERADRSASAKENLGALSSVMSEYREWRPYSAQKKEAQQAIDEAEQTKTKHVAEREAARAQLEAARAKVEEVQRTLEAVKMAQRKSMDVKHLENEVKRREAELERRNYGDLGAGSDATASLGTVKDVNDAIDRLRVEQDRINQRIPDLQNELRKLEQNRSNHEERVRKADAAAKAEEERMQEAQQLAEKVTKLKEAGKRLAQEKRELDGRKQPLDAKIRAAEHELENDRARHEDDVKRRGDAADGCRRDVDAMDARAREASDVLEQDYPGRQRKASQRLGELEERLAAARAEKDELEAQLRQAQSTMNAKEDVRKNVQNNLRLRQFERELADAQAALEEAEREYEEGAGAEALNLDAEYAALEERINGDVEERAELRGEHRTLEQRREELRERLAMPQFANIEQEYREKSIEHRTTEMAVTDLDKYYKAVDGALMKYHEMKIEQINRIVHNLWTMTYKGEDIDSIYIVGSEGGQTAPGSRARNYNYRLMMRKGENANLEMRGRCSAGQRVLASIVIRLALAETFCLSCGILALDEPTTNLDYDNKAGLAKALAMIVADRSRQHNFQLICITHDYEFVRMMNEELRSLSGLTIPDYYWKVERVRHEDGNGTPRYFSQLSRVDWGEMNA